MSSIAHAYVVKDSDLSDLAQAAVPLRRFLRSPLDRLPEFLNTRCRAIAVFPYSGFMLATVLAYLHERGLDVGAGHPNLAAALQRTRGLLLVLFLTGAERAVALPQLEALRPTASDLEAYDCQLNGREPEGQGETLVAALKYLQAALASVPEAGCVMVLVG